MALATPWGRWVSDAHWEQTMCTYVLHVACVVALMMTAVWRSKLLACIQLLLLIGVS